MLNDKYISAFIIYYQFRMLVKPSQAKSDSLSEFPDVFLCSNSLMLFINQSASSVRLFLLEISIDNQE